jgi:uncharacterized protein (DUF2237 family)
MRLLMHRELLEGTLYCSAAREQTSRPHDTAFQLSRPEGGDRSCLRVTRWKEALEAGVALQLDLKATHSYVLEFVSLEEMQAHALSSH